MVTTDLTALFPSSSPTLPGGQRTESEGGAKKTEEQILPTKNCISLSLVGSRSQKAGAGGGGAVIRVRRNLPAELPRQRRSLPLRAAPGHQS